MSVIPLIKYYEKKKNINQIFKIFITLISSKIINKFKFKKTIHQFYPVDHFIFTNKFLNYWKPNIAIFIESEIWPCMFKNLSNKKTPLILLNARLTKKTFNKWMQIEDFTKSIFNNITKVYPQNLETLAFLKKINSTKIDLIGNLKFVESYLENFNKLNRNLKNELKKKNVWIASSTHKTEETFCATAHTILKKRVQNLITVIIPRHVHRGKEIANELKNMNLKYAFHSKRPNNLNSLDIYIVDTFGETKKFHNIGSSVFLGGSIIKRGGQNPLEAASSGAKILHGPNTDNFKDIYKLLKSLNISKKFIRQNN